MDLYYPNPMREALLEQRQWLLTTIETGFSNTPSSKSMRSIQESSSVTRVPEAPDIQTLIRVYNGLASCDWQRTYFVTGEDQRRRLKWAK